MRNRLRGTLLSAAAGLAAAAAPTGVAFAQNYPAVTPGVEPTPGQRYSVPAGMIPPAGPAEMAEALPPGMLPPANAGGTGGPGRVPMGPGGPMGPGMAPPPGYGGPPAGPSLLPDSLRPYPRISPYDHRFDQFFHDGELWKRTANNAPRRYFGGASYMQGKFRDANRVTIGSRRTLDEVINELFSPRVSGEGFNNPTTAIDTIEPVGPLVILPWVKEAFLVNGDDLEYFGLAVIQEADSTVTGFPANRPRLVPFYDNDIDEELDQPTSTIFVSFDPATIGDLEGIDYALGDNGVFLDLLGYEPLTGEVFSNEDYRALLPNYDLLIGTQYEDADNPGIRLRFGWEEADGSGFEWTADWLAEDADVYHRGDEGNARRYFERLDNFFPVAGFGTQDQRPNLETRPTPLGVIVVDANPDLFNAFFGPVNRPVNVNGIVNPSIENTLAAFTYDLLYELEFSGEQAGTDFSYVFTPMVRKGPLRIRPSAGLRFNYLNEEFRFNGIDSGTIYVQDTLGEYQAVGPNGEFFPTPSIIVDPTDAVNLVNNVNLAGQTTNLPYSSRLENQVSTYLFGPQFGLHGDVEGKFLSVRSHVKAGVAVLHEEISVEGYGFNLNQNATGELMPFDDQQEHARFSPFVDANVRGEFNVFPYVPVLNRFGFLKRARFTAGLGVTSFWEVSRPLDSVIWREANSGNPFVNSDPDDRSKLYFTNWDLGVTWRY
ncbi:hypothetical protein [Alienimonas sp. DA493]|uniref:hypothetical protein n=1 Tax=Alienimonas sp. DA493 TaxID=3373605 RepID=UPI0037550BDB